MHTMRQSSAPYMYKISLIQIQITYLHEMAIFTHIILLSDMCAFLPSSKFSHITMVEVVFKIIHHTYIRTF